MFDFTIILATLIIVPLIFIFSCVIYVEENWNKFSEPLKCYLLIDSYLKYFLDRSVLSVDRKTSEFILSSDYKIKINTNTQVLIFLSLFSGVGGVVISLLIIKDYIFLISRNFYRSFLTN